MMTRYQLQRQRIAALESGAAPLPRLSDVLAALQTAIDEADLNDEGHLVAELEAIVAAAKASGAE